MSNLLKADLYALRKNRMTYILLAVCAGMALLTVGLYLLIDTAFSALAAGEDDLMEELGAFISGRGVMFGAFSLTNNAGIIIPVFAGIITMSDVRHGTVRNKIILGKSRVQIYFSHLTASMLLCAGAALLTFGVQAVGALLCFGYGVPFDEAEALNFVRCLTAGVLAYLFAASVATFFALATKSTPLTVILTLAVCFVLTLLCGISSLLPTDRYELLFELIPTYASMQVAASGMLSVREFWLGAASFLFFIAANTAAGVLIFRKADLK